MKSKILLALTLLLGVSTTTWAVGNLGKANQKKHAYTNEDVWAAYEGFNNTLLRRDQKDQNNLKHRGKNCLPPGTFALPAPASFFQFGLANDRPRRVIGIAEV